MKAWLVTFLFMLSGIGQVACACAQNVSAGHGHDAHAEAMPTGMAMHAGHPPHKAPHASDPSECDCGHGTPVLQQADTVLSALALVSGDDVAAVPAPALGHPAWRQVDATAFAPWHGPPRRLPLDLRDQLLI